MMKQKKNKRTRTLQRYLYPKRKQRNFTE